MNHTTLLDMFLLAGGCFFFVRTIDTLIDWYGQFTDPKEYYTDDDEDDGDYYPETSEQAQRRLQK